MPDLGKTTAKFIIALLKHQAKFWLGEDAAGIAAETVLDEDVQTRLDAWLDSEKSAKQLLGAVEKAQLYLQNPSNCPDKDLRHLFRDLTFGDLPSVQAVLTKLPQAMDDAELQDTLLDAFRRDLPNLSPEQHEEGARLYTDAMLRAVGSLEEFVSPILLQTVLDLKKGQTVLKKGQTVADKKLDKIIAHLEARLVERRQPSPTLPGDLPTGSYLPFPRNGFFTGRKADLQKLADALLGDQQSGVVVNQAVTGMGGIGKTQLAVEFAYEYGHRFRGVHWLDLREAQTLESQIALCGSRMGLPQFPPTIPEQVTATLREWFEENPRLLILDNFEEVDSANEVLARLRHSGLRLLITSRRTDWTSSLGLKRIPLDEFSLQESLEFLRNYLPAERATDEEINKLGSHLGHLPLALELAGRYLAKQSRLSVAEYLNQLDKALDHKSMQNWKAELKSLTGHDLSLLQTFARSWELVTDQAARELFTMLGFCAPNTLIPQQVLQAALGEGQDALDEILADLIGLALLKKDGPTIHPLLAQFARRLDDGETLLLRFSEALSELAEQTNHEEDRTGNYSLYQPILPHVRSIAEHAEESNLKSAGILWNELGYHIKVLADYAGAKAAFARALKIDEATYGADHPSVARDVNNLGSVLKALGDLAEAQAAYERAIKIWEANLGSDHPQVAAGVNNLGLVLKALGDLAGAQAAYERAIKIFEANLGSDHPQVATGVNNLGLLLKDLGDLVGAKTALERALKIFEKFLPPDHPNIKIVRRNMQGL